MEETGLDVRIEGFITATNDIFPDRHYVTVFMRGSVDSGEPRLLEPDKCEWWTWVSKVEGEPFLPLRHLLESVPDLLGSQCESCAVVVETSRLTFAL